MTTYSRRDFRRRIPRRYGGGSYIEGFCIGALFATVAFYALLVATGGV